MVEQNILNIIDSMTEEQKTAVYALLGVVDDEYQMSHSDMDDEDTIMFDEDTIVFDEAELIHSAMTTGSMKEAFIEHAETYGINDISELYPEYQNGGKNPETVTNDETWVNKIISGVHKQPFTRVKSIVADYTTGQIKAKGYKKATKKTESQIKSLLKRVTDPTTIYVKEKIDRDDMIDITDFNVVSWIKTEMKLAMNRELAKAILIGDGRSNLEADKISEECIRPIVSDDDLYSVKVGFTISPEEEKAKRFIDTVIANRKKYKGSGNPVLFTTEELISDILLLEDGHGYKMYKSMDEIKSILRVSEILTVTELEDFKRKTNDEMDTKDHNVLGIMVNLADYGLGANPKGQISLFEDFDIDYNQQKYLMETRRSGALVKPLSALVFEVLTEKSLPANQE